MKRWTSLLLSLLLAGSLALPAAAESADARLARVTEAVKRTLELDTEEYADFQGSVSEEELGATWSLYWSGSNGKSLGVDALEDGTVVSYGLNDNREIYSFSPNLPAFPKADTARAKAAAEAFLSRVLDARTEKVELEDPSSPELRGGTAIYFSGFILLNGLPSPLSYSIRVRTSDCAVTSFYREVPSLAYLGNIPSPTPKAAQSDAAGKLKGTLELELIYVSAGEEDKHGAVLRYVPKSTGAWYVDAQTGELVDASDDGVFFGPFYSASGGSPEAVAEDSMSRKLLTEVEREGVQKLEGVLDKEALDRKVRGESAYKLSDYTLASASYQQVKEDGEDVVLCTLTYTRESGEGRRLSRTFTVDGRTGAVRSLWSAQYWDKARTPQVTAEAAGSTARAFLARFTSHAAELELYDSTDETSNGAPAYTFTFARKVNGYFFPQDACTVSVDCEDGAVSAVSSSYDEKAVFDDASGLISAEAALDAWMGTYDVTLAYRALPRDLDPEVPAEAKLINMGITRFNSLFLSYGLERTEWYSGVDAKTGKPVERETAAKTEIRYDDVDGSWAEAEIARLMSFGIGYSGGVFQPGKTLTQWDLVCLLASAQGVSLDPEEASKEQRDTAYETAYRMGALAREERNDSAAVNRGELVKILLNAAGYGPVAKLPGIFTCSYSDASSIPAGQLGYAALAQGLGMVKGSYSASGSATRATAAVMLCRLMQRDT